MLFSGTYVDIITERYNTETIVCRTQLVSGCRLMLDEQTEVVSNSYTAYFSETSSLSETGKDLCIHLVVHLMKGIFKSFTIWDDGRIFCAFRLTTALFCGRVDTEGPSIFFHWLLILLLFRNFLTVLYLFNLVATILRA